MAYKCKVCGFNDVARQGDICDLCSVSQDPYAASMGESTSLAQSNGTTQTMAADSNASINTLGKGKSRKVLLQTTTVPNNSSVVSVDDPVQTSAPVQVYSAGQVPTTQTTQSVSISQVNSSVQKSSHLPLSSGIVKNVNTDAPKRYFIIKLAQALFSGVDFPLDDDVTMFQVFPDYTSTTLNAMGYACDQVVVYGKVNAGAISENNEVEVYGYRDSSNNIVAKRIINKASGTIITPDRTISANIIRGIVLLFFVILIAIAAQAGAEGIIWAVIIVLCLMNLPLVIKINLFIAGAIWSLIKRLR